MEAIYKNGQPVALVRADAVSVLPFSPRVCEVRTVTSLEEATAVIPVEHAWAIWLKVTIALRPAAARNWLFLSQPTITTTEDVAISFSITEDGIARLEEQLGSLKTLTVRGTYRLWLLSEPEAADVAAAPCSLAGLVSSVADGGGEKEGDTVCGSNERVIVGDTAADVAFAVSDLLRAVALRGEAATTVVCWPAPLPMPVNVHAANDLLRRQEHVGLLLPRVAQLHVSQRVKTWDGLAPLVRPPAPTSATPFRANVSWERHLLSNPHTELKKGPSPVIEGASTHVASGVYDYYHYRVDGFQDDGWGCAYRSLQTILSWFQHAGLVNETMPSLRQIQQILAAEDPDKMNRKDFVGSNTWIGSFEIMLVLQHYVPGLECTIRRLESGAQLDTDPAAQSLLFEHFQQPNAAPVMIGGSSYAHTILGVHMNPDTMEAQYLILDPHYSTSQTQLKTAVSKGYIGWKQASKFFESGSWYNLCIPRADLYDPR